MIIKNAKFVCSLDKLAHFPGQGKPEIALAGKSNVGKSSLINSLTRNSKLARTSAEPGKTRLINFYSINQEMLLVDHSRQRTPQHPWTLPCRTRR